MEKLKSILKLIDTVSEYQGRIVCVLIFPVIFIVLYEVISRYIFNTPTIWVHELSSHIIGTFVILGGAYALYLKAHVNVDVLYAKLSPRKRAILDLVSWCFFYLFIGIMLYEGVELAVRAWTIVERSQTPFAIPTYPLKTIIPIGAFFILLQGLAKTARDVVMVVTGKEIE